MKQKTMGMWPFILGTWRHGYYPAGHPASGSILIQNTVMINSSLDIVQTKYKLLNEIQVAFFLSPHFIYLRLPIMFRFAPFFPKFKNFWMSPQVIERIISSLFICNKNNFYVYNGNKSLFVHSFFAAIALSASLIIQYKIISTYFAFKMVKLCWKRSNYLTIAPSCG